MDRSQREALLERFPGPGATASDLVDRLEEAAAALLSAMEGKAWEAGAVAAVVAGVLGRPDAAVAGALEFAAREVVPRLARTGDEITSVLRALEGRFVPAGPSGSPTRGLVNVLPTGRNFYSVDPKALPSELSHATGQRLADDLLRRYLDEEGAYPETVGIVVWGTSAMRTGGDDIGEVLALLGVRPVWNPESRRVTGLEVVPLDELGRPRIDVTVRISGFFRDAFPNLVTLLDDAVGMVAGLDEPDERNFVAKHARAERAAGADWRRATTRVFGSKPGAYGAGLLPLIDARNWRDEADLVEVYEVWGGYAYGRDLDGLQAVEAMRANLARVRAVVKNVDTYEHDLLDSDDYFQYHGGMVAAVRSASGRAPRAYLADSADPARVRTRGLAEEVRRVVRARVVNPRWIASMARHGYKGAFELSATVDYLFGYDATTGVVEDWMYQAVAERYVLDQDTAAFMRRSNPWALRAIAERLLEAADRGLWTAPSEHLFERLRSVYLELEGDLEERQAGDQLR
jgi:cobaltochelatase CobN